MSILCSWTRLALLLALATGLYGCGAYPTTEAEFGNSVRQMIRSQAVYTGAVDPDPAESGDGQRLESVLDAYRQAITQPENVDQPIVINVGGN